MPPPIGDRGGEKGCEVVEKEENEEEGESCWGEGHADGKNRIGEPQDCTRIFLAVIGLLARSELVFG
jgi:hypothetical protein